MKFPTSAPNFKGGWSADTPDQAFPSPCHFVLPRDGEMNFRL